ncbi:hypothetical protein CERZMDRAFT_46160 [Cercospora zeae-maydis SCOH1-5]|uniref:Uncharacterized protein n=1 Tax=Cercospora zeae-maydis SCOH1-5 TaxID=717836 RepID=A0A6A6F9B4_9PEZI|nr:hypothetical protein CERZMDRAFT_46160 [Cercospora zeae-maydis SCOH1-5]
MSSASASASNPRKRSRKSASTNAARWPAPTSATSASTSMYDRAAPDVLLDNNILGPSYCIDPSNKKALQAALNHARKSLSPSRYPHSNFETFTRANYQAQNESELVSKVVHPFFTSYFDQPSSTDLPFTTLEPAVPLPYKMPVPKPHHSFGAAKEDIEPSVKYILCAPGAHAPVAVNDIMQVKGPDGKASVLQSQVTLDGAVGERAMHKLRSFAIGSEVSADSEARTFVQSYHAGTMKFYATHRRPNPSGGPDQIVTSEIGGQYLCGSPAQLRDGIAKYRNSVQLATRYRNEAVQAANARAREEGGDESTDSEDDG